MSSILRQDTEDTTERSIRRIVRNPIARASTVLERANAVQSADSQNQQLVRGFLLVDLGPVVGSLLENGGSESMATELLTEGTSEPEEDREGRARGILSKLVLVGLVVGLGAILRTRLGSGKQAITEAPDRTQAMSEETAMRSGEAAERTESITHEAASMIQASGEMAAERIQAGTTTVADSIRASGEETADQIQGVGETVEDVEENAEELASGMDNETDPENEE